MVPPSEVRRRYDDVLGPSQAIALDLLFGLRTCVQGIDKIVARWLGPDALSPGRFQILATLWAADGALPQRDIVKRLDVTRATISVLITALEKDALVVTSSGLTDRRQVSVALTPLGATLIARLVAETTTNLRNAFVALDDQELSALTDQLGRLTQSVNAVSSGK
jgi:DNA-binding MarR family transcriptional regulator